MVLFFPLSVRREGLLREVEGEDEGGLGTWKKIGITAEGVGEESNILSCIYSCQGFTLSCPQSSFLSRSPVTSMLPSPRPVLNLLRHSHEHVTREFFL